MKIKIIVIVFVLFVSVFIAVLCNFSFRQSAHYKQNYSDLKDQEPVLLLDHARDDPNPNALGVIPISAVSFIRSQPSKIYNKAGMRSSSLYFSNDRAFFIFGVANNQRERNFLLMIAIPNHESNRLSSCGDLKIQLEEGVVLSVIHESQLIPPINVMEDIAKFDKKLSNLTFDILVVEGRMDSLLKVNQSIILDCYHYRDKLEITEKLIRDIAITRTGASNEKGL